MLTHFKIDNFKSLVDFELPGDGQPGLGHLVCLIGLNGAGKSTVLQAIDFVSQLAVGDIDAWLRNRGWSKGELAAKGFKKRNIAFSVRFEAFGLGVLAWSGSFNIQQGRCTKEELVFTHRATNPASLLPDHSVHLVFEGGVIRNESGWKRELLSDFNGSVFNKLKVHSLGLPENDPHIILLLRFFLLGVKSLELLSPHDMRRSSKRAVDVGVGGENLAAFIYGLTSEEKEKLFNEMVKFYPQLRRITARNGKYGWKRFVVSEEYDSPAEFDARHVNDGLLRVAAVISQTIAQDARVNKLASEAGVANGGNPSQKGYQFILLDEIENGINPELVDRLVKYLLRARQQVFTTTHSPVILNYLPDDVARDATFLLYRDSRGATKAIRFFAIDALAKRLEIMGPGEAFLDVELEALSRELAG